MYTHVGAGVHNGALHLLRGRGARAVRVAHRGDRRVEDRRVEHADGRRRERGDRPLVERPRAPDSVDRTGCLQGEEERGAREDGRPRPPSPPQHEEHAERAEGGRVGSGREGRRAERRRRPQNNGIEHGPRLRNPRAARARLGSPRKIARSGCRPPSDPVGPTPEPEVRRDEPGPSLREHRERFGRGRPRGAAEPRARARGGHAPSLLCPTRQQARLRTAPFCAAPTPHRRLD